MITLSCDFETCDVSTNPDDGVRVWLWGAMDIYNTTDEYTFGNNIETFFEYLQKLSARQEVTCYFHNLKFDGAFILDYFLRERNLKLTTSNKLQLNEFNPLITDTGEFYSIRTILSNRKINILDSLKLLSLPLEKIGKIFKVPKLTGTIDYDYIRPLDHVATDTEKAYLKNDLLIVKKFVRQLFLDRGHKKMTLSSNAYNTLKADVEKTTGKCFEWVFPQLDDKPYTDLKKSYKGGICQVNYDAKQDQKGTSYDVNSLYPSMMLLRPLPYDKPILINDNEFTCKDSRFNIRNIMNRTREELMYKSPLYVQSITCKYELKKNGIPCIFSDGKINGFDLATPIISPNGREIVATMIDWWHIYKNYNVEVISYNYAYGFKKFNKDNMEKGSLFYEFIDRNRQGKIDSELAKNEIERLFYKTFQNASYGKFGTSEVGDTKLPYIDEKDKVNYTKEIGSKPTEYIPVAIFTTSWARDELLHTIYKVGKENFLYCDTDSIHSSLLKEEFEERVANVHNTSYGCWKYEYTFNRGRYLKAKTYAEDTQEEGLIIKCASMHSMLKKRIKYDDFYIGNSWENGNLKSYTVKGGKRLIMMDFRIA